MRRFFPAIGSPILCRYHLLFIFVHRDFFGVSTRIVFFSHGGCWNSRSWLIRSIGDSASLFLAARLLPLGVFDLNVWLLALATGVSLHSIQGRFALLEAATLAPMWDCGFEICQDNVILAGLLFIWWLGRVRARGLGAFAHIDARRMSGSCLTGRSWRKLYMLAAPPGCVAL